MKETETKYSSVSDTMKHRQKVQEYIEMTCVELLMRGMSHDESKMQSPEVEAFDEFTPRLSGMTFGSDEYRNCLRQMKPAIAHHHAANRHHPEHFEDGIRGMNLVDLVEMLCDWYAATQRMNDGDIMRSIEINQPRFGYSDDLRAIMENTARDIFGVEVK
jgi:hypothetical protein